jgi:NTP pyrophosphatase (non-canonical NTP hydrolase)
MQNLKENLEDEFKKLDENSSVRDLQEYTKKMIKVRGFDDETPQDIMLLLTEELGELAKEVRKSTEVKIDVNKTTRESHIDEEIADVFNYLLAMCRATNINLLEAFKKKEEINIKRTWK